VFPEDPDILAAKNSLMLIRKANPKLIIKTWYASVVSKYKKVIEDGDINFFIQKDYAQDLAESDSGGHIMEGINRLRKPVSNMSVESQAKTMKYLQNLSKLSTMYELQNI